MPRIPSNPLTSSDEAQAIESLSKLWWLWLVFGIIWTGVAVAVLQFDEASITTVGLLIGLMFLGIAVQNFVLAGVADRGRWLFAIFAVLFVAMGVYTLITPEETFTAVADSLGFIFAVVGIFWVVEAFMARPVNDLWWLGLIAGILMVILGFYVGGQFFIDKEYVLLVFAGIWALMTGITDFVRAFQIREIGRLV
ncbi:MAG: HdeD family acid-resistance protein [Solirubrobacterales bacterium]